MEVVLVFVLLLTHCDLLEWCWQVRAKVLRSPGDYISMFKRGVTIIWSLGVYWAALSYDCLVGRGEEMVPLRAEQLRNLLVDLGPSFVKAGQVGSILLS